MRPLRAPFAFAAVLPPLTLLPLSATAVQPANSLRHGVPENQLSSHLSSDVHCKRDDEHMHHHGEPKTEINETEILMWHLPTPPSYWSIDIQDPDPNTPRYLGLMSLHVFLMMLAFFVALPAGIAMRSVKHAWHGFTVVIFYSLCALGCAASALYRKLTPDMYEGSTHRTHGYIVLFVSVALSALDIAAFVYRLSAFLRTRSGSKFAFKPFWQTVVLGRDEAYGSPSEYAGLVAGEPEDLEEIKVATIASTLPIHSRRSQHVAHIETSDLDEFSESWADHPPTTDHRPPRSSDETLHDMMLPPITQPREPLHRIANVVFASVERSLVFAAFAMVLSGIVVYTGGCRDSYINNCLAHLIKGGIFWCYGLFTFARFLGSHSDMGWSWNISPIGNTISAEFVESTVIFLYGISNTWMERFGAHPGDPYTTKQVQHIGIAVMFWFAGLVGMGMESKRIRTWLAASAASALGPRRSSNTAQPASYRGSFNPFPALVIGVTGAAMSAHAQNYIFQVQIHQLWGWLLLGFSVLRCLTYFFLWLGPPRSILPSRPPTEALGSFFLACGGLMFMFSTEELTLAAMRKGRDDMMMFLNVAVAITCFAFCWTLCVVAFKGWLKSRSFPPALPSSP